MDVLKRLETMSNVELVALDDTVLRCLRGSYEAGDYARAVYQSLKTDLETGDAEMPVYSRSSLLKALRWELTEGKARKVYANTIRAAIDPTVDMTMVECGGGKLMNTLSEFWRTVLAACNTDMMQALDLLARTVITSRPPIDYGYVGPCWESAVNPNCKRLMDCILWDLEDGNIARWRCDRRTLSGHLLWCLIVGPHSAVYRRAMDILRGDTSVKFSDLRKLVK
jgi:hypothetical protein